MLTSSGLEPIDAVLHKFEQAPMPTTQTGWHKIWGLLNHWVRFIWKGQLVMTALREVQAWASQEGWRHFFSLLHHNFIRYAIPFHSSPSAVLVVTDASKIGWGAILLADRTIFWCSHGLWSMGFQHHVSNVLKLEALCTALRTFWPWILGGPVHAIMDNQAAVSFNNPANLSEFLKRYLDHLSWYCPWVSFCLWPFKYLADCLSRLGGWIQGPSHVRVVEGHHFLVIS